MILSEHQIQHKTNITSFEKYLKHRTEIIALKNEHTIRNIRSFDNNKKR